MRYRSRELNTYWRPARIWRPTDSNQYLLGVLRSAGYSPKDDTERDELKRRVSIMVCTVTLDA
jgi:hypothetical protein